MGNQRTKACNARGLVLDAGALIACERGDQTLLSTVGGAAELELRIIVPSSVLAQIWRGGPRSASLARITEASEVDALDEARAKEVGVRLGRRGASDVADAHVVCCAVERRATVATSDQDDMRALTEPAEELTLIAV